MSRPGVAASSGISGSPYPSQDFSLVNYPITAIIMLRCVAYLNKNLKWYEEQVQGFYGLESHTPLFRFYMKGGAAHSLWEHEVLYESFNKKLSHNYFTFRDIDCFVVISPYLDESIQMRLYDEMPKVILFFVIRFLKEIRPLWSKFVKEWGIPILPPDFCWQAGGRKKGIVNCPGHFLLHSTPYWEEYELPTDKGPFKDFPSISKNYESEDSFFHFVDRTKDILPRYTIESSSFKTDYDCPFQVLYKTSLAFMDQNFQTSLISISPRVENTESFFDIGILKMGHPSRVYEFDAAIPIEIHLNYGKRIFDIPVADLLFLYLDQLHSAQQNNREEKKRTRLDRAFYIRGLLIRAEPIGILKRIDDLLQLLSSPEYPLNNKMEFIEELENLKPFILRKLRRMAPPPLPPPPPPPMPPGPPTFIPLEAVNLTGAPLVPVTFHRANGSIFTQYAPMVKQLRYGGRIQTRRRRSRRAQTRRQK